MDKDTFYENLHNQLAAKYDVSPRLINTIRCFTSRGNSREEILTWLVARVKRVNRRSPSQTYTPDAIHFLNTCSDKEYQDIIQRTEFDKPND